jgi:glycosyltransferase involved in cell wall biosynthesis
MTIRLAIQQRVIPSYRAQFLELLGNHPEIELGVIAGAARPQEMIKHVENLKGVDYFFTQNTHLLAGNFYFCLQRQFLPWIKEWNPDVLIAEANPRYISTPKVALWMTGQHRPAIGWGLGVPQNKGLFSGFRNHQRDQFLKQFNSMIAYSKIGAQQYMQNGFRPTDVYVAMNATAPSPKNNPPTRDAWKKDRAVILYVGRLQTRKRLDALIRVCSQLPEPLQPLLWIVGDGEIRSDLEKLAADIYPQTEFFGSKFDQELSDIFNKADLFVLPGTGGLAVQQAMSFGLPVIVAEGDGTQSDLVNETNGWNITPENDDELKQAILDAITQPVLLRKKGMAAFEMVKTKVNIENMVAVFVQACKENLEKVSGNG